MIEYDFDIMGNGKKIKVVPESKTLLFRWADIIACYDLTREDQIIAKNHLIFEWVDNSPFVKKKGLRNYLLKVYRRRENLLIEKFGKIERGIYPTISDTLHAKMAELTQKVKKSD